MNGRTLPHSLTSVLQVGVYDVDVYVAVERVEQEMHLLKKNIGTS